MGFEILSFDFFPLALAAIIAYTAYYFRLIAISRMYLIYLEKEINGIIGKNLFTWNSEIIDNYLAKKNFSNKSLLIIIIMFFLIIGVFFGFSMCKSDMLISIKIGYCLYIAILLSVSAVPFGGNERIRKSDYDPEKK